MKTPYEIAWNLLDHYVVNAKYYFMSLSEISKNTGLDESEVEKMRSKFCLLKKIQDTKDGVYLACELLSEIELGKPHYLLDEEQKGQNHGTL